MQLCCDIKGSIFFFTSHEDIHPAAEFFIRLIISTTVYMGDMTVISPYG